MLKSWKMKKKKTQSKLFLFNSIYNEGGVGQNRI